MPATTMVSQFSRITCAVCLRSARCSAVMPEAKWSHPRKSLPGQVPSSSAFWAAFTRGSSASTAPAVRNCTALFVSKRIFLFIFLICLFSFDGAKLVQGECRTKRKAVQSERKGYKKRKSFYLPFPNCSRLYAKAVGFSFFMPSRSLTYEKLVQGESNGKKKRRFLFPLLSRKMDPAKAATPDEA